MNHSELASRLAQAETATRLQLFKAHPAALEPALAQALKALFDETKASDPVAANRAAAALTDLAALQPNAEIIAFAEWVAGMAALQLEGQVESALAHFEQAENLFNELEQAHQAAATQVSKLHALAVLGRYDEALACGLQARAVFLAEGDALAAGKIELNLGNLNYRRDNYAAAEQLYRTARKRFAALSNEQLLLSVDTSLATALIFQHRFREAATLYEQALPRAAAAGLAIIQAIIECDLGCLALMQGRYDQALQYLELSRRRYEQLGMPHDSAIAELELADAYLELNLAPEAARLFARVIPLFAELGMQAEQARALTLHGRALVQLRQFDEATAALSAAQPLYQAEANDVGSAAVQLTQAQLFYWQGRYDEAAQALQSTEKIFAQTGAVSRQLLALWLNGEIARARGSHNEARTALTAALREAETQASPHIAFYCQTSLGRLAAATGKHDEAHVCFSSALSLLETMRAPLPADEFRTAFIADKLTPYLELARLSLGEPAVAFCYVERARARALMELVANEATPHVAQNEYETELLTRLDEARAELNWFYSQLNRTTAPAALAKLNETAREREASIAQTLRQLEQSGSRAVARAAELDLADLQNRLGAETALIEYFALDDELQAFVVTNEGVQIVSHLGQESHLRQQIEALRFQLDSLRYGAQRLAAHMPQLIARAQRHLASLYDALMRPLLPQLGARRLAIVPYRSLHYLPFNALHDGTAYLIESREISYAPSAGILLHCLQRAAIKLDNVLLLGIADHSTPQVRGEIEAIQSLFPAATVLHDEAASLAALRQHAPQASLLHLACHGQFRPDSPLFSSLQLADGWLTVRDAAQLNLSCGLVTLSACETGLNTIAPGDELLGLTRGFFSAGAPALLMSLWKVADESTSRLMKDFYARVQQGQNLAAALRAAQCALLHESPHPFFWAPFTLSGRW